MNANLTRIRLMGHEVTLVPGGDLGSQWSCPANPEMEKGLNATLNFANRGPAWRDVGGEAIKAAQKYFPELEVLSIQPPMEAEEVIITQPPPDQSN
jgi:hypothetical protein